MNRMARCHLLRNHVRNRDNDEDAAAFQRFAMLHRQNARDRRGNALDLIMAPFGNVRAPGLREARYQRVTVNGSTLR